MNRQQQNKFYDDIKEELNNQDLDTCLILVDKASKLVSGDFKFFIAGLREALIARSKPSL
jgi:hypothetical protein